MKIVGVSPPYRAFSHAVLTATIAVNLFTSSLILCPEEAMPMPFQYLTANDIPERLFQQNKVIRGRVEKVIDGDTIRVRHYPFYYRLLLLPHMDGLGKNNHKKQSSFEGKLSENTISVRIYAVDCPETAHFGNPAQPFSQEATDLTRRLVDGKMVRLKLLRRDQYSRAVAKVETHRSKLLPFLPRQDVSMELASHGLCTLYTGRGAEYDGNRHVFEKKIDRAQQRKLGIWGSKYEGTLETPQEYKKRVKKEGNGSGGTTETSRRQRRVNNHRPKKATRRDDVPQSDLTKRKKEGGGGGDVGAMEPVLAYAKAF